MKKREGELIEAGAKLGKVRERVQARKVAKKRGKKPVEKEEKKEEKFAEGYEWDTEKKFRKMIKDQGYKLDNVPLKLQKKIIELAEKHISKTTKQFPELWKVLFKRSDPHGIKLAYFKAGKPFVNYGKVDKAVKKYLVDKDK